MLRRLLAMTLMLLAAACEQPTPQPAPLLSAGPRLTAGQGAACAGVAPLERGPDWRRGVSLGLFVSDPDEQAQRRIYGELLDEIRAVGATDVQIAVRWAQPDIYASALEPSGAVTTPDAMVGWVLDAARARGLRTFLMPIIHVERRSMGQWRGTLHPRDRDAWWSSYERFILRYAQLARAHDVSLLAVGSELLSMERDEARWRALIGRVRAVYPGQLTYSGNWDHFEVPAFWDALDVAGMTAYQELSGEQAPDRAALRAGWQPFITRYQAWRLTHELPVIITEVGYPSHEQGAAYPWDYRPRGEPDVELQARAYEALAEVWGQEQGLDGVYMWNWFGPRDARDRGYTPRGKPAEQILSCWYAGRPLTARERRSDP